MIKRQLFESYLNDYKAKHRSTYDSVVQNIKADSYDVFLSHSSKDASYALFVRKLLIDMGFTVYIDLFDPTLGPKTPDKITGYRLTDVINKSKCIFYIHSQKSDISQWCPWELGFGDGLDKKIVVLEIADDDDYKQEFLVIYPFLKYLKADKTDKYYFWVYSRANENKYVRLDYYVKNNQEPYLH